MDSKPAMHDDGVNFNGRTTMDTAAKCHTRPSQTIVWGRDGIMPIVGRGWGWRRPELRAPVLPSPFGWTDQDDISIDNACARQIEERA